MERQYSKPKNKKLIVLKPGTRIIDIMRTAYLAEARKYNARESDKVIEQPAVSKPVKIIIFRKPPAMPVRLEKAMPCRA
jgi:hypothetical protein